MLTVPTTAKPCSKGITIFACTLTCFRVEKFIPLYKNDTSETEGSPQLDPLNYNLLDK